MAEVPRGREGREAVRVTFTKARSADGKEVAWHSIRLFWKDDTGTFRPSKTGITIRGSELRPVAIAMLRACASNLIAPELVVAAKKIVTALEANRAREIGQQPAASTRRGATHRDVSAADAAQSWPTTEAQDDEAF